jgi:hypothetical protein
VNDFLWRSIRRAHKMRYRGRIGEFACPSASRPDTAVRFTRGYHLCGTNMRTRRGCWWLAIIRFGLSCGEGCVNILFPMAQNHYGFDADARDSQHYVCSWETRNGIDLAQDTQKFRHSQVCSRYMLISACSCRMNLPRRVWLRTVSHQFVKRFCISRRSNSQPEHLENYIARGRWQRSCECVGSPPSCLSRLRIADGSW